MNTPVASQSPTLPTVEDVQELVECLYGEETIVKETSCELDPSRPIVYAPYLDASGGTDSYLICDIDLANSCGAALSMIHPSSASDSAKAGVIPENLFENIKEVLNIAVSLVGAKSKERLTLGDVQIINNASEIELSETQAAWSIEIPKYTTGKLVYGKINSEETT